MSKTTSITHIAHTIQILKEKGLSHAVVSPGSRNAPIIIALNESEEIEKLTITDERSAGFIAMGIALQTEKPVALVCTSGSAVLNYAPAVAEAFYQNIPLLILSADRPSEWTDQGDGQTIRQIGTLEPHVHGTFQIDCKDDLWPVNRMINEAWNTAIQKKGPVHINLPLSEPLYNVSVNQDDALRLFEVTETESVLSADAIHELKNVWNSAEKKMILIGQHPVDLHLKKWIDTFANFQDVCILTENLSNIQHPKIVHCIDRTLAAIHENDVTSYQPDLLITLGNAIVSKRVKKFLRGSNLKAHWRVGTTLPYQDTYCQMTQSIPINAAHFIKQWSNEVEPDLNNRFGLHWKQLDYITQEKHQQFINRTEYADLKVFHTLFDFVPDQSVIHLGNSSVVRYAQLFDPTPNMVYHGNRGTSGIDGSTSTAVGAAFANQEKCHVIITGDLSFFYDSNALWNKHLTENLRIILINNSGGDIFKIIEGPDQTDCLENYFHATHKYSAEYICKAFDIHYMRANSIDTIENQMIDFYEIKNDKRPVLLEVFTPTKTNSSILKEYFKALA